MPTARDFRVQAGGDGYTVTGTVECPTQGWTVLLLPDPAASTPEQAALTVRATQPPGVVPQVVTPYEVNRVLSGGVSRVVVTLTGGVTTEDGGTRIELAVP